MTDSPPRPWNDFNAALEEHFGTLQRAQTNFCENSRFSLSSLQHWRKTDKVPEEAFSALTEIDASKCSASHSKGRLAPEVSERVVELSSQNKSLMEIATILAKETDRPITENMIKGIRYRNKEKIASYRSREVSGE